MRKAAFPAFCLLLSASLLPSRSAAQAASRFAPEVRALAALFDEAAGKVTIKHGPLKKFGMDEGMTMVFRAGDATLLKAVKPGDRVHFVPDRINGQFTVTKIEKAK